ncbi:hypothetical protein QO002_006178 [Pararhizobium capsulatum DSM 1112]|uniref:Uncharacterized protein n=1 Tax=Pararhizobium capsulatum DSM 1112 TaxID=1121113 RepID=A0ABU0C0C4_9HYPH|nr:hypothetical protein [Pararhizobium capsulatum DSM 1112]
MDRFLEFTGIGIVIVTFGAAVAVFMSAGHAPGPGLLGVATWALPTIVGGVVLAAFGRMLGELKALRHEAAKQTGTLDKISSYLSRRRP